MFKQGMNWPFVQCCSVQTGISPSLRQSCGVLVCSHVCKTLLGLTICGEGGRSPGRPAAVILTWEWTSALHKGKMYSLLGWLLFPSLEFPMAWLQHRQFPNTSKHSQGASCPTSNLLLLHNCAVFIPVSKCSWYLWQQRE